MRIALLGAGRIGTAHAANLRVHPEVSQLLIADSDAGRARSAAELVGAQPAGDVDAALAAAPDAVVIATPTSTHAELILRAVDAGVPVFCEKPVAGDVRQTVDVARRVAESGIPVQIGFQRRFDAGYQAARAALRAGEVGTLHRLHLVTGDPAPPHANYVPLSGGIFRDCHIHDFDIARWLTGTEVVEVYATGANRGAPFFAQAGDVDTATTILTFADGTLATVQGSRYNGAGYDVRAELAGTRGTYVVGLDGRSPLRSAEPGAPPSAGPAWPDFWHRFRPAYAAEMAAFLDLVAGRTGNPCPVADALEALYVAEAAELSRHERRPVRVDEVRGDDVRLTHPAGVGSR
ncbi:Gfo/Idh/MocA family oxidoreductase [Micromonospora polyrhachis]|uniref:Myo-inositol 2-dehydrogenase/D-chiro-inositol 1-dehydrogenase n=1 Tax=Micromonospora polyrhachis TaxID=1282883 RepID=A0A7W7SWC8_9ACTN|nr:Gfo/Idh/MocA family oxidoreductase [Micromonospora polyrhachis]MBB4962197.1 myo-inositol 2-dehydrogenase/D-chiro-inositol 1-dehydrogenase [Micromonospora polyrhachis]